MKPPRIKRFLLDGEELTRRVVTFDPAMKHIDVMITNGDNTPVIQDGKPVIERLTGNIEIEWDTNED
jgi:hypothetical protein